jgi:hypothetical protein
MQFFVSRPSPDPRTVSKPCLAPGLDRGAAIGAIKALLALGYRIERP